MTLFLIIAIFAKVSAFLYHSGIGNLSVLGNGVADKAKHYQNDQKWWCTMHEEFIVMVTKTA
jgi:hypothetical protein